MRLHILGIGGSFMGGVARLARDLGHTVTGSDANVYPPMSTQLAALGIPIREGYDPAHLDPPPDLALIGNALSRGNPLVEAVLDRGIPYASGAQWLAEEVLRDRWTLAVAGTHGKTTTSAMLAWILDFAGLQPGFLIGGVPENFEATARLGELPFFVIEADEYDTAFFDKRSKFVHYRPRTLVLNNLEYDHADIFPDLDAIKRQFHHLVRTVPASGRLVVNSLDKNLAQVLEMGCWSEVEPLATAAGWEAAPLDDKGSGFRVLYQGMEQGVVRWTLLGRHNMFNALAAIAAARHAGVAAALAIQALTKFRGIRRRLEVRGTARGITVYDDFAHHPTAIAATLSALRAHVGDARLVAVLEPRSNTMRLGVHRDTLAASLSHADKVVLFRPPGLTWNLERVTASLDGRGRICSSVEGILSVLGSELHSGDHVIIMSNGGFDDIHAKLLDRLQHNG